MTAVLHLNNVTKVALEKQGDGFLLVVHHDGVAATGIVLEGEDIAFHGLSLFRNQLPVISKENRAKLITLLSKGRAFDQAQIASFMGWKRKSVPSILNTLKKEIGDRLVITRDDTDKRKKTYHIAS